MNLGLRSGSAVLALALTITPLTAQERPPEWYSPEAPFKTVFLEIGGAGFVYSANAQLRVDKLLLRAGFGIIADRDGDVFWAIPVIGGTLMGKGPHFAEVGGGLTLADLNEPEPVLYGTLDGGYRYVRPSDGLTIRASLTPHFTFDGDVTQLWLGASIGKTF